MKRLCEGDETSVTGVFRIYSEAEFAVADYAFDCFVCTPGNMQDSPTPTRRSVSPKHPALRNIDPATRFLYTPKTVTALLLGTLVDLCKSPLRSLRGGLNDCLLNAQAWGQLYI